MRHPYAVQVILDHFPHLKPGYVADQLRYSSFVSVPKRYMYFEVPKAACTQMKELLRTLEDAPPIELFTGGLWVSRRDMFVHARQNVPLPSLIDLDNQTQREVLESAHFFRLTVVRNPYTRLISVWKNKVMLCEPGAEEMYLQIRGHLPELHPKKCVVSFEEFVDYIEKHCDLRTCDPHWRRQVDHTFFAALNFSCVAKMEHITEGLHEFQQHLGVSEPLRAPGTNVSALSHSPAYSRDLAEKVFNLYKSDFELLGYDRSLWPAGRQKTSEAPVNGNEYEDVFRHEIVERNIIISTLYQERERLQAEVKKLSRTHLLTLAKALLALRRIQLEFWSRAKTWVRQSFRR